MHSWIAVLCTAFGMGCMGLDASNEVGGQTSNLSTGDSHGPSCTDINGGEAFYDGTSVTAVLHLLAPIGAGACTDATYSLYVLGQDATGAYTVPLGEAHVTPANVTLEPASGDLIAQVAVAGSPTFVCVYATTAIGPHLLDRAPNASCFIYKNDPTIAVDYSWQ